MEKVERIGVSLDKKLLSAFDKLIGTKGYQSRSEAIRDLIRRQISEKHLDNPKSRAIAVILLVYDHHSSRLMQKLTALQHSHLPKPTKYAGICSILHQEYNESIQSASVFCLGLSVKNGARTNQ